MRARRAAILALAGLAVVSCRPTSHEKPGRTVAVRVLDLVASASPPGIVRAADVLLDDETRRAVSGPAIVSAKATLEAGGPIRRYRVEVPPEARPWGEVDVVRNVTVAGRAPQPLAQRLRIDGEKPLWLPVAPTEAAPPSITVFLYGGTRPEAHDVETAPFVVPSGADLDFGVGIQSAAPRTGEVTVRIAAWDGTKEHDVWRARLSSAHTTWRDERASLAALAGRRVSLRFSARPEGPTAVGIAGVFGEPVVLEAAPAAPPPLHVVLVSLDTLRAQSVGVYGCARPTTPTFDALAAEGVLFENAFSTAAFTLPGHMSMFAGLWFRTHNAMTFFSVLAAEHRTLPERLQSAGWATAASTSNAWIIPGLGFRRGFDHYHERKHRRPATPNVAEPHECFTRGLAWLAAHRDRSTFLFLHSYQVHFPYRPPPPYSGMFGTLPAGAWEGDRRLLEYERGVRYSDDQLRALLEGIDALGLRDRTLLIVTSDHGEAFGEHGIFEHTFDVHDEIARVPLVVRLPGVATPGLRVAEPVSLADLAPTIVDVAGLAPMTHIDGTSLLPLLTGRTDHLPRDAVFTEAASAAEITWADLTAAHTRTHSCIHDARSGAYECWDRRRDPWQRFAPEGASTAEADAAKTSLARFESTGPPPGSVPTVHAFPGAGPTPNTLDVDRIEQLRALGYVQ